MDFHLDYGLRIHTEPKHKSLYEWAINEVEADGSPIDQDQIPWEWTLFFSATSCVLTNQLELVAKSSLTNESAGPPRFETIQTIRMTLRPGVRANGEFVKDAIFSMFGTKRIIQNFTLEIRPLDDPSKEESCSAWGSVSYTSEVDFCNETVDDCVWFHFYMKPETFANYLALIGQGRIHDVIFSVGSVEGFYSEWSPSISTDRVKVLLSGAEHKFDLPPDFQGKPPRLGRVNTARLVLHRHLELSKDAPSPYPVEVDQVEPEEQPEEDLVALGLLRTEAQSAHVAASALAAAPARAMGRQTFLLAAIFVLLAYIVIWK